MSQSIRQSELFAGSDWQVLYRAFTDVNFNASDPPSINRALRSYIQQNYPENFNDWIESSEFVALIDLLSWLAGTLAFKTDLNARESFLETAEQRESILRLARFISYNPRRNQCGQGLVKLVEVSTDDDVLDGFGVNLNGSTIQWDNPDDPDWFERFILILNSAFISTNQFGVPLKSGIVANAKTQLYRLNNEMSQANMGFKAKVSGASMDFEVINADFDDAGGFYEREPNFENAFHMFYRNDGNGNSSGSTGFFLMFKQGTLQRNVFNIPTPVENNVLNINSQNVNDTDVWVQTVTDSGSVLTSWSKVPAIFNENITYNNYDPAIRDIFSVLTRDNDSISVRFSDGRFGTVPTGNIRVFYRVSNGLQYQIRPTDMNRIKLVVPYYNRRGVQKNLSLTFSLQSSVSNSTPRETDDQVKARAPSVYATQNRMVSGEDYNTFPLQSNLATKLKAINRVYSGHSRFIDLNDPTGNYQDVNVYADDGIFFREPYSIYTEVPMALGSSASDIVTLYIQPTLNRQEVTNYASEILLSAADEIAAEPGSAAGIVWHRADTDASFTSTGYFSNTNQYLVEGATVEFATSNTTTRWATIAAVNGDSTQAPPAGSAGPVTLSQTIPEGAPITRVIPRFATGLDTTTATAIQAQLTANQSFTLYFDYSVDPSSNEPSWAVSPDTITSTMFKVMTVDYSNGGLWSIVANGVRYVFESQKNVQWYNDGRKTVDAETGVESMDYVRILKINEDLHADGGALDGNYDLAINHIYINRDGSADPKRITVSFADYNLNGYADNPETFRDLTDPHLDGRYLFWQNTDLGYMPMVRQVAVFESEALRRSVGVGEDYPAGTVAFQITANSVTARELTFWVKGSTEDDEESGWAIQRSGAYTFGIGRGPNVAASWTGGPDPQEPGNSTGLSPDWQDWWEEIQPPTWITPSGSLVNTDETTLVFGTVLATDPQGLTITYLANAQALPQGSATISNATSNGVAVGAGISLDANSGVFSGRMPDVAGEQVWSFDVVATNGILSSSRSFTMRAVDTTPTPDWITPPGLLGSFAGGNFAPIQLTATNGGRLLTYTKVAGSFPNGVFLSPDGVLQGTMPEAGDTEDNYQFTIRASNGLSFDDRDFSVVVSPLPAPMFAGTKYANGVIDVGFNVPVGNNFGPMLFLATSNGSINNIYESNVTSLPDGLTFGNGPISGGTYPNNATMRGVLTATPGTYYFTLRAAIGSIGGSNKTDQVFKMTVVP